MQIWLGSSVQRWNYFLVKPPEDEIKHTLTGLCLREISEESVCVENVWIAFLTSWGAPDDDLYGRNIKCFITSPNRGSTKKSKINKNLTSKWFQTGSVSQSNFQLLKPLTIIKKHAFYRRVCLVFLIFFQGCFLNLGRHCLTYSAWPIMHQNNK